MPITDKTPIGQVNSSLERHWRSDLQTARY